ncbi:hypothetical protein CRUP_016751 [Coryphaenoides rupestris]|nr:hypothetical protein CRUP_016751 [Coryphaenoides rupestris]
MISYEIISIHSWPPEVASPGSAFRTVCPSGGSVLLVNMAADSEEDFVTYGVALEPLEEDEPRRRPVPLHEQTVKDEKGRFQRFHGAFTGGFSAGYFNTVGSQEGWTPAAFVSTRQQKASQQQARPEDFMDEEDFGEHGIAPREISTSSDYQSSRRDEIRDKASLIHSLSAPIPGDVLLEELIAPARLSIGVELLRRMGWKEGQGVGPRVKRKATRQKTGSAERVSGCAAVGSEDSEDDCDFAPENMTFAPKDISPIDFTPKVGVQGLGYHGLDPSRALGGGLGARGHINLFRLDSDPTSSLLGGPRPAQKHRGGVAGQVAFGVGALEDDDDEEVYHRDAMSNYDRVLGGEEPGDGLYGWTAPQQYKKKKEQSSDVSSSPPRLPPDFRPVHHFRPVVDLTRVSPLVAQALQESRGQMVPEQTQQTGRHQLDSGQRGALLGESTLQGPTSVLDLLRPGDRERLANLRSSSHLPPGPAHSHGAMGPSGGASARTFSQPSPGCLGPGGPGPLPSGPGPWAESVGPSPGGLGPGGLRPGGPGPWPGGLGGFKPFEKNPSKQARYERYVSRMQQGDRDALDQSLDGSMTEWERSRERDEFSRSAVLYRPGGSLLSSRFTSGKHTDDQDTVDVPRDQEMFGKLTRDSLEWHPDKLLCKRFNLPHPYPGSGLVGLPTVKRDRFSVFNFLNVTEPPASTPPTTPALPEPSRRSRWDVSTQKTEEDPLSQFLSVARTRASDPPDAGPSAEPGGQTLEAPGSQEQEQEQEEEEEEEEESRPSMDLFKAIFASSSDEKSSSSSEDDDDDEEEGEDGGGLAGAGSQPPGLFNITSALSSPTASTAAAVPPPGTVLAAKVKPDPDAAPPPQNPSQEEEEFGPKLPPPSAVLSGEWSQESGPQQEEPARSKERRSKERHKAKKQQKHKKDKKKKKEKKQKHKAKEKRKRRNRKSGSSSEEEDDDPSKVSTQELLQSSEEEDDDPSKVSTQELLQSSEEEDDDPSKVSTQELLQRLKTIRSKEVW